jgi:hypothetical protein
MSDIRSPGPSTIERCVAAWQRAQAAIATDDELTIDEQPIASAFDADPSILSPDELLRRIVRALVFAEARQQEAKTLVGLLQARQRRYANRAAWLREELLQVMVALERPSFAAPFGTVTLRAGVPSAVIIDEEALPDEYIRITRKPDGTKILADLKQGVVIEGAVLSNGTPSVALYRPRAIADETTDPETTEE